jgi:hypothetical protein
LVGKREPYVAQLKPVTPPPMYCAATSMEPLALQCVGQMPIVGYWLSCRRPPVWRSIFIEGHRKVVARIGRPHTRRLLA